ILSTIFPCPCLADLYMSPADFLAAAAVPVIDVDADWRRRGGITSEYANI
ncbi:hypothetical protein GWI33_013226, partial [Rhynchophorus ferrugineus]